MSRDVPWGTKTLTVSSLREGELGFEEPLSTEENDDDSEGERPTFLVRGFCELEAAGVGERDLRLFSGSRDVVLRHLGDWRREPRVELDRRLLPGVGDRERVGVPVRPRRVDERLRRDETLPFPHLDADEDVASSLRVPGRGVVRRLEVSRLRPRVGVAQAPP